MLDRIMVPLDGSKLAEAVLAPIIELALALGGQVHLVHVCDGDDAELRYVYEAYLAKIAGECVERMRQGGSKPSVRPAVMDGKAAEGIIDYADAKRVDLIAMTSHGRSGAVPWALGSVATKVIHGAHVPVLVLKVGNTEAKRRPPSPFSRILMPLDGSVQGEAALPYVKEIACAVKCDVFLLRVIEPEPRVRTIGGIDHFMYGEQQVDAMKAKAAAYLDAKGREFDGTLARLRKEVRVGDAASEIVRLSADARIGLTALSTHGESGLTKWMLGSVSEKIVHAGKTSILLVKASAGNP